MALDMCEQYGLITLGLWVVWFFVLGFFFYIKVLKCKVLGAWKVYAFDIYFSFILGLSAEMTICNLCKNILPVCLELFSGASAWGFAVFIECSWVFICFALAWVGRYLRTRKKGVPVRETHRLEWDAFIAEFPYAVGGNWLSSLWCLSLKWEPCVSVPCMITTAFLAQNMLLSWGGDTAWHPYILDLETKMKKTCISVGLPYTGKESLSELRNKEETA